MKKVGNIFLLIMGIICFTEAASYLLAILINLFNAFVGLPISAVVIYFVFPDTARAIAGLGGSYLEWILGTIDEYASTSTLNSTETILYAIKYVIAILGSIDAAIICGVNVILNIACGIVLVITSRKQKMGLYIASMVLGYLFFGHYIVLAGGVLGLIGCINENRAEKNKQEEAEKAMAAEIVPEDGIEEISPAY